MIKENPEYLYNNLYSTSKDNILWGQEPGRLVKQISQYIQGGDVLDIGCGDGKNALYLEEHGFNVVGYEVSTEALTGLKNRFNKAGLNIKGKYEIRNIENDIPSGEYDVLVSYGIFHCLNKETRVAIHRQILELIRPNGFLFFTCLTNGMPLQEDHGTSDIYLVDPKEIESLLSGWVIRYHENGIITEDHLPLVGEHQHSAEWIIAQKI